MLDIFPSGLASTLPLENDATLALTRTYDFAKPTSRHKRPDGAVSVCGDSCLSRFNLYHFYNERQEERFPLRTVQSRACNSREAITPLPPASRRPRCNTHLPLSLWTRSCLAQARDRGCTAAPVRVEGEILSRRVKYICIFLKQEICAL